MWVGDGSMNVYICILYKYGVKYVDMVVVVCVPKQICSVWGVILDRICEAIMTQVDPEKVTHIHFDRKFVVPVIQLKVVAVKLGW
jgi:hypothetical protein